MCTSVSHYFTSKGVTVLPGAFLKRFRYTNIGTSNPLRAKPVTSLRFASCRNRAASIKMQGSGAFTSPFDYKLLDAHNYYVHPFSSCRNRMSFSTAAYSPLQERIWRVLIKVPGFQSKSAQK